MRVPSTSNLYNYLICSVVLISALVFILSTNDVDMKNISTDIFVDSDVVDEEKGTITTEDIAKTLAVENDLFVNYLNALDKQKIVDKHLRSVDFWMDSRNFVNKDYTQSMKLNDF